MANRDPRFAPNRDTDRYVRHFNSVDSMVESLEPARPVYCIRPSELARLAAVFRTSFPGKILYAVKCNPHPTILRQLWSSGVDGFDAASLPEITLARDVGRDAEVGFLHPVKSRNDIRDAYRFYGVRLFVVDHMNELEKMFAALRNAADVTVLVRFKTPKTKALYELSEKFGATEDESVALLNRVSERGWKTGLAFHVGSQCTVPSAYRDAVVLADKIQKQANVPISILDVGGGFPANYPGQDVSPLDDYFVAIRDGLAQSELKCALACEPGRALVASAVSLVTQVQLRKESDLYINDGVYHSLSEAVTGHLQFPVRHIPAHAVDPSSNVAFRIFGPTCDSTDILPQRVELPASVREGDWIEFSNVGAYSNAVSTDFNGLRPNNFVTIGSSSERE